MAFQPCPSLSATFLALNCSHHHWPSSQPLGPLASLTIHFTFTLHLPFLFPPFHTLSWPSSHPSGLLATPVAFLPPSWASRPPHIISIFPYVSTFSFPSYPFDFPLFLHFLPSFPHIFCLISHYFRIIDVSPFFCSHLFLSSSLPAHFLSWISPCMVPPYHVASGAWLLKRGHADISCSFIHHHGRLPQTFQILHFTISTFPCILHPSMATLAYGTPLVHLYYVYDLTTTTPAAFLSPHPYSSSSTPPWTILPVCSTPYTYLPTPLLQ